MRFKIAGARLVDRGEAVAADCRTGGEVVDGPHDERQGGGIPAAHSTQSVGYTTHYPKAAAGAAVENE